MTTTTVVACAKCGQNNRVQIADALKDSGHPNRPAYRFIVCGQCKARLFADEDAAYAAVAAEVRRPRGAKS